MDIVTGVICSKCKRPRPEEPGPCANCGETRRTFLGEIEATVGVTATLEKQTTRGPRTWSYIYMVMGLLVTIALAVISVLDIPGWARAIIMLSVAAAIIVILIDSGPVHNLLLRIKRTYEDKPR